MLWRIRPSRPVLGALLRIPKRLVDVDKIRADLTITNNVFFRDRNYGVESTEDPTILLWEEDDRTISVPRHYRVPWKGHNTENPIEVTDRRDWVPRWDVPIPHKIQLRNAMQREASYALHSTLSDKVLSLHCGGGKTVVTLHALNVGNRFPALIVVPTNALLDQWRKVILQFYEVNDEDIGHIQGSTSIWRGKPISIAMLHTLVLKDHPEEMRNYFRTIVGDEIHHWAARLFSKAAPLFSGERWGLTATVEREDRMEKVFLLHMGSIAYENLEQPLKPKVYFVPTELHIDLSEFMSRRGQVNLGRLQTFLSEHEKRNELILWNITEAVKLGRTILILGERLAQLHEMAAKLRSDGYDASVHVGSMSKEERAEALKHQIVFATQQLAREGLDRPAFDTLFVLVPFGSKGRLQQSIGRILRELEGKKTPKAVVFVDDISIISALARKMKRAISAMGYDFEDVERKEGEKWQSNSKSTSPTPSPGSRSGGRALFTRTPQQERW